jgi:3-isopropylmalate/(R)-2-methylmalate dehydratase small subunit
MSAGSGRIDRVQGRAIVLSGDDIDTDRIMPARFLKAITFDGLEAHVFEDDRAQVAASGGVHAFDASGAAGARVLVVGANFGCGSSREHAPRAIAQRGIRAVVGESFAEIFASNSAAIGLPCVTMARGDLARVADVVAREPGAEVSLDLKNRELRAGDLVLPVQLPDSRRDAFLSGQWDATAILLERYDEVATKAGRLPYIAGF